MGWSSHQHRVDPGDREPLIWSFGRERYSAVRPMKLGFSTREWEGLHETRKAKVHLARCTVLQEREARLCSPGKEPETEQRWSRAACHGREALVPPALGSTTTDRTARPTVQCLASLL